MIAALCVVTFIATVALVVGIYDLLSGRDLARIVDGLRQDREGGRIVSEQAMRAVDRAVDEVHRVTRELGLDRAPRGTAPDGWEPTTGREPGEPLERFINRTITARMETFRLGIEQQLPMLAALRYATDEKLADVVTGLRAAIGNVATLPPSTTAPPSQLAGNTGTGTAQLTERTDGDEAKS